jgi:uridine kinase
MNEDDGLGPLLLAPPGYLELRVRLREAMGFPDHRQPLLIGIDGVDGSGKSSLAAWLSWQLEMPAIHLDVYVVRDSDPLAWRLDDIARAVEGAQSERRRPVILEGIMLLRVLKAIGHTPVSMCLSTEKTTRRACEIVWNPYFRAYQPKERANFVLRWSSASHDARVLGARHARHGR